MRLRIGRDGTKLQSVLSLRKLGDIDREMIEHRARTLCERRADGDIPGMLEYFAVDIVCMSRGHWSGATFPRRIVGKAAVAEAYRQLNIQYENLGSVIHELLVDGDRVVLHRTTTVRNRGAGKMHTFDVMNFARFRDGLVVELSEYPDLAAPPVLGDLR
jgi:ketosteroid isomerase-like protein